MYMDSVPENSEYDPSHLSGTVRQQPEFPHEPQQDGRINIISGACVLVQAIEELKKNRKQFDCVAQPAAVSEL